MCIVQRVVAGMKSVESAFDQDDQHALREAAKAMENAGDDILELCTSVTGDGIYNEQPLGTEAKITRDSVSQFTVVVQTRFNNKTDESLFATYKKNRAAVTQSLRSLVQAAKELECRAAPPAVPACAASEMAPRPSSLPHTEVGPSAALFTNTEPASVPENTSGTTPPQSPRTAEPPAAESEQLKGIKHNFAACVLDLHRAVMNKDESAIVSSAHSYAGAFRELCQSMTDELGKEKADVVTDKARTVVSLVKILMKDPDANDVRKQLDQEMNLMLTLLGEATVENDHLDVPPPPLPPPPLPQSPQALQATTPPASPTKPATKLALTTPPPPPVVLGKGAQKSKDKSKDKSKKGKRTSKKTKKEDGEGADAAAGAAANPGAGEQTPAAVMELIGKALPEFRTIWDNCSPEQRDKILADMSALTSGARAAGTPPAVFAQKEETTDSDTDDKGKEGDEDEEEDDDVPRGAFLGKRGGPGDDVGKSFVSVNSRVRRKAKDLISDPKLDWQTWQEMTTRLKLTKRNVNQEAVVESRSEEERRQYEKREQALENLVESATAFSTRAVDLVVAASRSLAQPDDHRVAANAKSLAVQSRDKLVTLLGEVKKAMDAQIRAPAATAAGAGAGAVGAAGGKLSSKGTLVYQKSIEMETLEEIEKNIRSKEVRGVLDNATISAAISAGFAKQIIISDLERAFFTNCESLRLLVSELLTVCAAITENQEPKVELMEIAVTSNTFMSALCEFLNRFETTRTLKLSGSGESDDLTLTEQKKAGDRPLWSELLDKAVPQIDFYQDGSDKIPEKTSLNRLIEYLTSPGTNAKYKEVFVMSAPTFTTPSVILDKLIERYNVPDEFEEELRGTPQRIGDVQRIHGFVGILMGYWIKGQFDEFDDNVIQRLKAFLEDTMMKDMAPTAQRLLTDIARCQAMRKKRTQFFAVPPTELLIPEEKKSPQQLFMEWDDAEIARQLTLIDYRLFSAIRPREMMSQAWCKSKLMHRAPNMIRMIKRAPRISFWVAHAVLSEETPEARARVCEKFVRIAVKLKEYRNYNSFGGIVAGLSASPVSRLAKTFGCMDSGARDKLKEFESFVDPSGSFQKYRKALNHSQNLAIPMMCAVEKDLIFSEDGNDTMTVDGRINFSKCAIVCQTINQIRIFQNIPRSFCVVEPLNSFLSELPELSETEFYNLSLKREPRLRPSQPTRPKDKEKAKRFLSLRG